MCRLVENTTSGTFYSSAVVDLPKNLLEEVYHVDRVNYFGK